jgi:tRNA-2-methylthio-N6-dimethylallyladenosine synthase
MKYHVWTIGCQMNTADSQRLGATLEGLGYRYTARPEEADVIVLNTCVVRQSAEDKACGRLDSLKSLKARRPGLVLGLMGCLVGVRGDNDLWERFPHVDIFLPPSDPGPLVDFLLARQARAQVGADSYRRLRGELLLPAHERGKLVAAYVPVVYGCSQVCAFCIIPRRRGGERSRPLPTVVAEAHALAAQGVREVTLLGQIVDRYGYDLPGYAASGGGGPRLNDLLRAVHEVEGVQRIRFLTSHPAYLSDEILDAVASLPKVCEHIEIPVQSGDDEVLRRMGRGYSARDYRRLVAHVRERLPGVSIASDVIVGFPGESEAQFMNTCDLLAELELDVVHIARYSPRPGTVASKTMEDDVPAGEKERRRAALDALQAEIVGRINSRLLGQTVEVLVEEQQRGKWKGRTRTNKLVFFEDEDDWRGKLAQVRIAWAGPWSMQGELNLQHGPLAPGSDHLGVASEPL